MHVENLILEVTRKCNLKCEHCLRGNAQNKSMSMEVMQHLFAHVTSVGTLTIGGGEPTLALPQLKDLYQILSWCDISVDAVFLVTNGKTLKLDLLRQYSKLLRLCAYDQPEDGLSGFGVSNDPYHRQARGFHRYLEDYEELLWRASESACDFRLSDIPIREHTNNKSYQIGGIIARGRAKDWGDRKTPYLDCLKFTDLGNPATIDGEMYVCYNGDVVGDANMAYNDMKRYRRGNVLDWDNLMSGIRQSTIDNYYHCKEHCSGVKDCYDLLGPQIEALKQAEQEG